MYIRHVTPEDFPIIKTWWDDRSPDAVQELIKRAIKLKDSRRGAGYIALCSDNPCGFAMLTYWSQVAEISDLLVIPAHRGQGIGTQLLGTLKSEAHQTGYSDVEIGVLASNTSALRLYQRVGFVPVRTIQHKFAHGYEDIIYLLSSTQ